jgi:hypothetical protein
LFGYPRGVGLWLRNAIYRHLYFAGEHDIIFFSHSRRKLENDGYWWDTYCDPIHEQGDLNNVHFESHYLLSHRTPTKTNRLRYLELIQFTGTLRQKPGLRKPNIPTEIANYLKEAEIAIHGQFDADIDLVTKVQNNLHARKTTLPLYECLLKRTDPKVVVIVVFY